METISSPYNFVPLSKTVVKPSWGQKRGMHLHALSHDAPLQDGLSGNLEITLTNHTPLLIAGNPNAQGEKTPLMQGSKFLIPGSSVRGMLRNVVEIATYSKFGPGLEERKLFARDLTKGGEWYRYRMVSRPAATEPKSKPGWLKLMKSKSSGKLVYVIEPTKMERIPIAEAKDLMGDDAPGTEVEYDDANQETYIVVRTGEVHGKKNDFGFRSQCAAGPMAVTDTVFQSLIVAHQYNVAWWVQDGCFDKPGYLQKKLRNNERIPVFYTLGDDKKISAVGLAYMFRVAYKHSLVDAMTHTSQDHRDDPKDFDVTQALFGALPGDAPDDGLRSRVSFGALFSSNGTLQAHVDTVVLNSPKPSFYPAYLKQDGNNLKDLEAPNPELAGWKRYQIRSKKAIVQTGDGINDAVTSKLKPLQPGAQFNGVIRFHNLRPAELGALVWALTWGSNATLRHSMGMGKPYGYGNVAVQITGANLTHNSDPAQDFAVDRNPQATTQKLAFAVDALTAMMKAKVSQWPNTTELKELYAMANPAVGDTAALQEKLRYPMLNSLKDGNEFKNIKNNNRKLAKPSSYGA